MCIEESRLIGMRSGGVLGKVSVLQMLRKRCLRNCCRPKWVITANSVVMRRQEAAVESARQRLARRLRAERAKREISQEELADRAGVHRTFVGSVERAERNISIDNVEKLARALQLDIAELLSTR